MCACVGNRRIAEVELQPLNEAVVSDAFITEYDFPFLPCTVTHGKTDKLIFSPQVCSMSRYKEGTIE
jgi:hypothetical protein